MQRRMRVRPAGSLAAIVAAAIAFATAGLYLGVIASQGDADVAATAVITTWLAGLGTCALIGGLRSASDRVIPLGAATGGLFGAAVLSLFSIGALLLLAGICGLVAWIRAGVDASRRDQLLGAGAGIGAALGFFAIVLAF